MNYLFERYRREDMIDFLTFMDDVFSIESSSSYFNAFAVAEMPYYDPYARLKMADELDLYRVRHGEPKYLIRENIQKFLFLIRLQCHVRLISILKIGEDLSVQNSR